jgi:hypothetical protein
VHSSPAFPVVQEHIAVLITLAQAEIPKLGVHTERDLGAIAQTARYLSDELHLVFGENDVGRHALPRRSKGG